MSDVAKTANQWTQEEIDESDVEAKRLHELLNRPRTNPTSGRDGAVKTALYFRYDWPDDLTKIVHKFNFGHLHDEFKTAFLKGWDARDEEVKRLREALERIKARYPYNTDAGVWAVDALKDKGQ